MTKETLIQKLLRNDEGHYTMIRGSIQQEQMSVVNIYELNTRAPCYLKQLLRELKWDIDSNTIIMGTSKPHFHQWTDY